MRAIRLPRRVTMTSLPCSTCSSAASDAHPARLPFPGLRLSAGDAPALSAATRPGRASPVPIATFRAFHAPCAGEFFGAAIQALRSFLGLRRERLDSTLPFSRLAAGTPTTRQASLDAADRSVAPPCRALDAGLRPDPFPGRVAGPLPGLLAATRAGTLTRGRRRAYVGLAGHLAPPTQGALGRSGVTTRRLYSRGL
jgi:hypothetical protein